MDMKRDYYEDVQFLKDTSSRIWFAALLAAFQQTPGQGAVFPGVSAPGSGSGQGP